MHSGSPFYHFKSKGALLYAVMEEGMRSALQRQAAALQAAGLAADGAPALAAAAGAQPLRCAAGPGSDFIPVMLYESRSITTRQRSTAGQTAKRLRSRLGTGAAGAGRGGQLKGPVKLARLLIFGALNWSVQWFDAKKSATLDDLTDAAMALFIHAPALEKPLHQRRHQRPVP
jgi:AcrR family transcriptional regulator